LTVLTPERCFFIPPERCFFVSKIRAIQVMRGTRPSLKIGGGMPLNHLLE
jgi:hypothetical protein